MADAPDLGSGVFGRRGSSPLSRTQDVLRRPRTTDSSTDPVTRSPGPHDWVRQPGSVVTDRVPLGGDTLPSVSQATTVNPYAVFGVSPHACAAVVAAGMTT
jgi:hypothetical protein